MGNSLQLHGQGISPSPPSQPKTSNGKAVFMAEKLPRDCRNKIEEFLTRSITAAKRAWKHCGEDELIEARMSIQAAITNLEGADQELQDFNVAQKSKQILDNPWNDTFIIQYMRREIKEGKTRDEVIANAIKHDEIPSDVAERLYLAATK